MLRAIHVGMSGMRAYSSALDVISNNVANLNTPGFKLSTVQFQDLFYRESLLGGEGFGSTEIGSGVQTGDTQLSFAQGDIRSSGNRTDVAIDGNGFFVVREGEGYAYTRAGQFELDDEGYLVTSADGRRVVGLDGRDRLVDINVERLRTTPAEATSRIELSDNLSTGSVSHDVTNVVLRDAQGGEHEVTLRFTNDSASLQRSWKVEVLHPLGLTIADAGEVRFSAAGSPLEGYNTTSFTYATPDGQTFDVTIDMGEPGGFSGATSFSGGSSSTLRTESVDGRGPGDLLDISFDAEGVVQASYTNGASRAGVKLALASFDNPQELDQVGRGFFEAPDRLDARYAGAGEAGHGRIAPGSVEISNVELTDQFTELIIVQRGFQASSQILTTANEMMQELMDAVGSGR